MADPLQFPAVPMIGQPVTVMSWICIVHVRHNCQTPTLVDVVVKSTPLGLTADLTRCPSCAQAFHIGGLHMNPHGQLEFGFEMGPDPAGKAS